MSVELVRYRFSLDQYERMFVWGVLKEDDRVELIEGEIVEKVPPSPDHSTVVTRLTRLFIEQLAGRGVVRVQDAARLPPRSEPEPDLVIALPPDDRYTKRHPEPADVLLMVEVSYSTQTYDRSTKMPLYARHGVPEVWLVDVPSETFEVYREPERDGYASVTILARGGTVSPAAFPDMQITIDEVLP